LYEGLKQLNLDRDKLLTCFDHYLELEGNPIYRAAAEERMLQKLERSLTEDIAPLLPAGVHFEEQEALKAFAMVWKHTRKLYSNGLIVPLLYPRNAVTLVAKHS
jgi:hypothetical protein